MGTREPVSVEMGGRVPLMRGLVQQCILLTFTCFCSSAWLRHICSSFQMFVSPTLQAVVWVEPEWGSMAALS